MWKKNWKVIDLLELVKEIGGANYHNHPVYDEWRHFIEERSQGNDKGILEWIGNDDNMPLINEFLLNNGFESGEKAIIWVCW